MGVPVLHERRPPGLSDTPVIVISDGCGQSTQEVDLDDSAGRWTSNGWGYRGSASCAGGFADVMQAFFEAEAFDYAVADGALAFESDDGEAEVALRRLTPLTNRVSTQAVRVHFC